MGFGHAHEHRPLKQLARLGDILRPAQAPGQKVREPQQRFGMALADSYFVILPRRDRIPGQVMVAGLEPQTQLETGVRLTGKRPCLQPTASRL